MNVCEDMDLEKVYRLYSEITELFKYGVVKSLTAFYKGIHSKRSEHFEKALKNYLSRIKTKKKVKTFQNVFY